MTDATIDDEDVEEAKPSKLPLIIGVVLALAGGGGGFFVVSSGMLGGADKTASAETKADHADATIELDSAPLADVAFVELPQLLISLGPKAQADHLRFRGSLEVPKKYAAEVEGLLPRFQDVMNSYLMALDPEDLEKPGALVKLRAQMLRRVALVAGEGRINDMLVLEFVLN